jgi:hypothetical protein
MAKSMGLATIPQIHFPQRRSVTAAFALLLAPLTFC